MKIVLLADGKVGSEIAAFLVDRYPQDLALLVTTTENDTLISGQSAGIEAEVFESDAILAAHLVRKRVDLGVLAWWPRIIKLPLLEVPTLGFINTHPSMLPFNRGKHYNFWTIVEEAPFGVSLHFLNAGVDTGDLVAQQSIEFDWCDNGGSLYSKAQRAMVELFCATYPKLREGHIERRPQDLARGSFHLSTEIEAASRINLDKEYRGRDMLNLLRARTFEGHPGCWFEDKGVRYEVRVDIRRVQK
jgi:methionyl-tRNA formyltransferase